MTTDSGPILPRLSAHRHTARHWSIAIAALLLAITSGSLAGVSDWGGIAPFNLTRLLELGLLALLSVVSLLPKAFTASPVALLPHKPLIRLTFCCFWLLGLIAATRAPWPSFAFLNVGHALLLTLTIPIFARLLHDRPWMIPWLFMAMAIGMTIAIVRFFVQFVLTKATGVTQPLLHWYEPYANPRFFAQAMVWVLPLLALLPHILVSRSRPQLVRYALITLSISTWALLLCSGSRGALIGLIIGFAILWLFFDRAVRATLLRPMLRHAAMGVLLWALLMTVLGWSFFTGSASLMRLSSSGRIELIQTSWTLIKQHPWVGIGPAQFSLYHFHPPGGFAAHPHNILLQVAVEWGVPATLLLIVLLFQLLRWLYHAVRQHPDDVIAHALLLSLFGFFFLSLVDGPQIMPLSLICVVLCMGMLLARIPLPENQVPSKSNTKVYLLMIVMLLAGWLMVLQGIVEHPACATYPLQANRVLPDGPGYDNPRFWQQGRLPIDDACLEVGRYHGHKDMLYGKMLNESTQIPY